MSLYCWHFPKTKYDGWLNLWKKGFYWAYEWINKIWITLQEFVYGCLGIVLLLYVAPFYFSSSRMFLVFGFFVQCRDNTGWVTDIQVIILWVKYSLKTSVRQMFDCLNSLWVSECKALHLQSDIATMLSFSNDVQSLQGFWKSQPHRASAAQALTLIIKTYVQVRLRMKPFH